MEQYISKSAVVAEIKGYISNYKEIVAKINRNDSTWMDSVSMIDAKIDVLQHVLFFLDTLKVKDEVVSTDPIKAMKEALRTEYEKGRADAFAEMQKEWSEEDKDFMYDTLSNLTELKDRYGEGYGNVGKCIDWLKILKQRIGWKPSEEQIECLYDAVKHYQTNGYPASKLNELYEQMSKIYKL